MFIYACVCVCMCVGISVRVCVHVCTRVHACLFVCTYVCCVCWCVCNVHAYACMVYTHTRTLLRVYGPWISVPWQVPHEELADINHYSLTLYIICMTLVYP